MLRDLPAAAGGLRARRARRRAAARGARSGEARREIAIAREAATNPTHAVVSVTALAKKEGPRAPTPAEDARGTAWGRVLHQLLEAAMRTPGLDLRPLARNLMREEEVGSEPPRRRPPRRASPSRRPTLWARASTAARRFVEVPFEMLVPSKDLGLADGPAETLLKGAMDLVFEEDGVWHIVDWKSDVVGDGLAALVAHYAPQVEHYRRAWETLTGQTREGGALLHGHGGSRLARRRGERRREDFFEGK